ncbi:MAG: CARDB domain-containing protein [Paracoccaceae bacterium]
MPIARYENFNDKSIFGGFRTFSFNPSGDLAFSEVESVSMEFFIDYQDGAAVDLGKVDIWVRAPDDRRVKIYSNFDGFGKDTDDNNDSDGSNDYDISFWGTDSKSIISLFLDGAQVRGDWKFEIQNDTGVTLTLDRLEVEVDYNFRDVIVKDIKIEGDQRVGEEVTIRATAENVGNLGIGQFSLAYYVNGTRIGDDSISFGLFGGQKNDETIKYTITDEGINSVEVRIYDSEEEGRTDNNSRTETFDAVFDPEVAVMDLTMYGEPTVGEEVQIKAELKNLSDSYVAPFSIEYFVNGESVGSGLLTGGLFSGQNWNEYLTYTVEDAGEQEVEVRINRLGSLEKGDLNRTEYFGVSREDEQDVTLANSSEEIEAAAFFARLIYGDKDLPESVNGSNSDNGRDDNYRDYVALAGWTLLDEDGLGFHYRQVAESFGVIQSRWQEGGLFEGNYDFQWPAQGLLAEKTLSNGDKAVVLTFRGTDPNDGLLAATGQAWTGDGLYEHYMAHQDLVEAAISYVNDTSNGIDTLIVSGHSLGGSMADIFASVDAHRVKDNVDLKVVALASAGVDPDVYHDDEGSKGFADQYDTEVVDFTSTGAGSIELSAPSYYIGLSHWNDRVTYAGWGQEFDDTSLSLVPNLTLFFNHNFYDHIQALELPNVRNDEIGGFGAEHNAGLYWANISALVNDPLLSLRDGHWLQFGRTDYTSLDDLAATSASDSTPQIVEGLQESTVTWINDSGSRALEGQEGSKRDFILGLDGDDEINTGAANDLGSGGAGDDTLNGGTGSDTLHGGADEDSVMGEAGNDHLMGGSGDDTLEGGVGKDTIEGGDGVDEASYENASDRVVVKLHKGEAYGGDDLDSLSDIENVTGSAHNDKIVGDGGANQINAGAGDDVIFTLGADDTVNAEGGNDSVYGDVGSEVIDLGDGDDFARSKAGDDHITLGTGDDRVAGGAGEDTAFGGAGNDIFFMGSQNDFAFGGAGQDTLNGGFNADVLDGGADDDRVRGEAGVDQINGGDGDDLLNGGENADTFWFFDTDLTGVDRITDFEDGLDVINLSDWGFATAQDVLALATSAGGTGQHTRIYFADGSGGETRALVIENLDISAFDVTDIVLVSDDPFAL